MAGSGFIATAMQARGRSRTVWQQISDGAVLGYVAADGPAVALSDICERTVLDAALGQAGGNG